MPTAKKGGGASTQSTPCHFSGSNANAFVYYNDFAKTAAATLKASGKEVYINFDVSITSELLQCANTYFPGLLVTHKLNALVQCCSLSMRTSIHTIFIQDLLSFTSDVIDVITHPLITSGPLIAERSGVRA